MICRFLFLCICALSSCFGEVNQQLSLEETVVLKQFFRILIEESEVGYVLFGKKPVCIHGFYRKDPFLVGSYHHKQSVAIREGSRVWNKLTKKKSDTIIHISKKEDPNIPRYIHVLAINRPLFEQIVSKNLALFQYILGPSVTPKLILNALTSIDNTYYTLLNQDKVLIGEILGFGTQNSLYVSRTENIQEAEEEDTPPFLNSALIKKEYSQEYLPFTPGFGCSSIEDELQVLEDKIEVSSKKLVKENPPFIFGCLKDCEETEHLISELEIAQEHIQKLLASPSFLEELLNKLTGKDYSIAPDQCFQFQFDNFEINKIVAKGIWESLQDYDAEFLTYFFEGFKNPETLYSWVDPMAFHPHYLREVIKGISNLEKADNFFLSLSQNNDFQSVVPQKLYYRVLKEGDKEECRGPLVSLQYSMISPLGHCLAHESKKTINLNNTISGFRYGIKGMRVGETRVIYMHPSLAYGFNTSLGTCIYLKAHVTLLETHPCNGSFQPRSELDLSFLKNSKLLEDRAAAYKLALKEKGASIASHLKKCKALDLAQINDYLHQFMANKAVYSPTTDDEQQLINQVHWNIYFSSNKHDQSRSSSTRS